MCYHGSLDVRSTLSSLVFLTANMMSELVAGGKAPSAGVFVAVQGKLGKLPPSAQTAAFIFAPPTP